MNRQFTIMKFKVFIYCFILMIVTLWLDLPWLTAGPHSSLNRCQNRMNSCSWNHRRPLIIAHRGASAYLPQETIEAARLAVKMGANALEFDLCVTKDLVLVAIHDNWLSSTTNIAELYSELPLGTFPPPREGLNGDGLFPPAGAYPCTPGLDWWVEDFTLEQLKLLRCKSPIDPEKYEFQIATFEEFLQLQAEINSTGRKIAIFPELKFPAFYLDLFGSRIQETIYLTQLKTYHLNRKRAPIYTQCFEPTSLQYLRSIGCKTKQVQLIGAYDLNWTTGEIVYVAGPKCAFLPYSQPTDWKLGLAGPLKQKELFNVMLTPEGLKEIKEYADGIGPWKPMVIPVVTKKGECAGCNKPTHPCNGFENGYPDTVMQPPTQLIRRAHRLGLLVFTYTFKNECDTYGVPSEALKNPKIEYQPFFEACVDGVFTNNPNTGVKARRRYFKNK